MNNLDALMVLNAVPGLSNRRIVKLLEYFGTPESILKNRASLFDGGSNMPATAKLNIKQFDMLEFLQKEFTRLRTPIALGWSLLGLNAWDESPSDTKERIHDTHDLGKRFGGFDTPSLCLLLAPLIAPHGLNNLFTAETSPPTSTAATEVM